MARVTSDASTVSWIVPGYATSRGAEIVSVFAVAAGRLFCGGTGCASDVEERKISASAAPRIRQLLGKTRALATSRFSLSRKIGGGVICRRVWHFVELKGVVSASSLCAVSGNSHDNKNDAAGQRSIRLHNPQPRECPGRAGARRSSARRPAEPHSNAAARRQ